MFFHIENFCLKVAILPFLATSECTFQVAKILQQSANFTTSGAAELGSIQSETADLIGRLSSEPENFKLRKHEVTSLAQTRRSPNRKRVFPFCDIERRWLMPLSHPFSRLFFPHVGGTHTQIRYWKVEIFRRNDFFGQKMTKIR